MTVSVPLASGDRSAEPYARRRLALSTMHRKDEAVAPPMRDRLGVDVVVPPGLDTDAFGTFSGEIERQGTMGEVAVAKARMGMSATGLKIGVASEGTYGPHPQFPLISAGIELLVLVDEERGIVVSESLIDEAPCFDHTSARPGDDIAPFLRRIAFPDHAVIVGPNAADTRVPVAKGIREHAVLAGAIAAAADASRDGLALVQTDMRALMNPTRMTTLGRLSRLLCDRLLSPCPSCAAPGFGVIATEHGLPCEWCGGPSVIVSHQVLGCVTCDHRETRPRPDGLTHADPGNCPACNP